MKGSEIVKVIRDGGSLFDFVANNGWKLDKEQLITIIKELDDAIWNQFGGNSDAPEYKEVMGKLADNLEENAEWTKEAEAE